MDLAGVLEMTNLRRLRIPAGDNTPTRHLLQEFNGLPHLQALHLDVIPPVIVSLWASPLLLPLSISVPVFVSLLFPLVFKERGGGGDRRGESVP